MGDVSGPQCGHRACSSDSVHFSPEPVRHPCPGLMNFIPQGQGALDSQKNELVTHDAAVQLDPA